MWVKVALDFGAVLPVALKPSDVSIRDLDLAIDSSVRVCYLSRSAGKRAGVKAPGPLVTFVVPVCP